MGLNTWAAFVGTNDNAAVAGDVAMLAGEVQPVLKVLRQLASAFKAALDRLGPSKNSAKH